MEPSLFVAEGRLWRNDDAQFRVFDPWSLIWQPADALPAGARAITAEAALAELAAANRIRRLGFKILPGELFLSTSEWRRSR